MVRVARRRDKVEPFIEGSGRVVFRVDRECPDAGNVRRLQCAKHGVLQEAAAEALVLPGGRDGKTSQQHDRQGMTGKALGQPLGRIVVLDLPNHERIVTGDLFIRQGDVSLRGAGLLVLKGVPCEEAVERFPAAIESVDSVAAPQLLDS